MVNIGGNSAEQLRALIERIEKLEEEKREISDQIKDVYKEAKGSGLDVVIMRQIVKERRADPDDLAEHATLIDLYRKALNEWSATPLGEFADEAE